MKCSLHRASLLVRRGAALSLLSSTVCFAGEPQYSVDPAFRAPVLTARGSATRLLVLPDNRFFAFSVISPGFQPALHRLNGDASGNLVRFMADGMVDGSFKLDRQLAGYAINAVALTSAGKLVIGCIPSNPAVDLTNRVLQLNPDGSIDPSFNEGVARPPGANQQPIIQAIAVDGDGRLLIAGQFGNFNDSGRSWIVRLHADGTLDSTFAAVGLASRWTSDIGVITDTGIAVQPDRKVIIAGAFDTVNGVSRPGVARLRDDGTLDTSFVPQGFVPSDNYQTTYVLRPPRSVALQPSDGTVFLAGIFNPVAANPGTSTQMLIRLHANGAADSSFNAPRNRPTKIGRSVRLQADGRPLIAVENNRGDPTGSVVRFETSGAYDSSFISVSVSPSRLDSIAPQADGRVIFAGTFRALAGIPFSGVARTNTDGSLDSAFRPGELQREWLPTRLAQRRDGGIVVTGIFERVNNTPRTGIALLKRDGSLSSMSYPHSFTAPSFFLSPDDKLLLYGTRTDTGKFASVRFNPDTTVDTSFSAAAETMAFEQVALEADQSYLLSSGTSAQAVANEVLLTRMQPDGSRDETFELGIDEAQLVEREEYIDLIIRMYAGNNRVLSVLPNEKILYHYFDRDRLHKVVLLNRDGSIDANFHGGVATPRETRETFPQVHDSKTGYDLQPAEGVIVPSGVGPSVALVQPDGRIIVGGQFTSYNGTPAGCIVRLNSDGSLNSTFGGGATFMSTAITYDREPSVTEIQRDFAGRVLVVGDFDAFDGVPSPGIARLNGDGSLDATFVAPVSRRIAGNAFNNRSVLVRQGAGRFLLSGNYAATAGSSVASSILRLEIPSRATRVMKTPSKSFQITFTGVPSETYQIEHTASMSSAFIDSGARVQAAPDGTFVYEDASAFGSLQRFYRAVSLE